MNFFEKNNRKPGPKTVEIIQPLFDPDQGEEWQIFQHCLKSRPISLIIKALLVGIDMPIRRICSDLTTESHKLIHIII
jgi:hypothetical protein